MSKADKMLEELGYESCKSPFKSNLLYEDKYGYRIWFDTEFKEFTKENGYGYADNITMQELQAINEKCKELRWL